VEGSHWDVKKSDDIYLALMNGLHGFLQRKKFSEPPADEMVRWLGETRLLQTALEQQFSTCRDDLCPLLGWEGNSDVAGRGV
jgi:hypothetical protein